MQQAEHLKQAGVDLETVKQVKALLGEHGYTQAFAPIEEASGLPNTAYWSPEWLALEQTRLFHRNWVFAGAEAEIPDSGDIKPLIVGGAPMILVRDEHGKLRCFHNVCRHRGAQLIGTRCSRRSITCPYHAWNYGLDGRLRRRMHFAGPGSIETFDHGCDPKLDLVPARVETWNGCVFVDISGRAAPLDEWLSPLAKRTQGYDFSAIRWAGRIDFDVKANWKLVFENYMEGYHVFSVHPQLLEFAPMNLRWSGEWLDHLFYNDYVFSKTDAGRGEHLPHYPGLAGDDARRGLWFLCFPHFAAEVYPDQFTVLATYPVAPDLTREELHVFLIGDAATSIDYQNARKSVFRMWDSLNREDLSVLEQLQQGRRSPAYDGGRLSPHWEGPTHQFGRHVIEGIVAL